MAVIPRPAALPEAGTVPRPRPEALRTAANTGERVCVGLSGGVDSAVAALLLQRQGYRVEAVFMKNWEEDDRAGYCAAAADLADATAVCAALAVPLATANFATEYWERVFMHFLEEYRRGRTPNPDVLCNREVKFRAFLEHALNRGATRIATGHYARSHRRGHRWRLLKGFDPGKDQSYFLHALNQRQLGCTLFPLGELSKTEVRRVARERHLPVHAKPDSTGICFIGERPFREFLARYLPARPGEMRTPDGTTVGVHGGLMYYTPGQRKGLGLGGRADGNGAPWFVLDKDLEHNVLYVGQGHGHPWLYSDALLAEDLHWISGEPPALPCACHAKIRYRQPDQPCKLTRAPDGRLHVRFARPQWAVAPGQSVVFYQDQECLGGGIIVAAERARAAA